jgi:uncharacterized RDD family membrane protein YckC
MTHSYEKPYEHRPPATPSDYHSSARPSSTPEDYTPWITRVLACLIDTVPLALVWGVAQVVGTVGPSSVGAIIQLLAFLAVSGYAVWNYGYRQGTTGSSVGKSFMNFIVVSEEDGRPIGFGRSILRQLAHVVDSLVFGAGYLFPLWDAKRQTLADKIMVTICQPNSPWPQR